MILNNLEGGLGRRSGGVGVGVCVVWLEAQEGSGKTSERGGEEEVGHGSGVGRGEHESEGERTGRSGDGKGARETTRPWGRETGAEEGTTEGGRRRGDMEPGFRVYRNKCKVYKFIKTITMK